MSTFPIGNALPPNEGAGKTYKVVKSNGRGQTCAPQGNIISTVRFTAPEVLRAIRQPAAAESDSHHLLAELGPVEAFQVQQGDLVYSLVKPGIQLNVRQGVDRDGEEQVFAHVGGLRKTEELRFAGHADYSPHNANPGDDVGTIARAGTRTVVNTGPWVIDVNSHVYFSSHPIKAAKDYTGRQPPAIQETGQHPEKFRPALYAVKKHHVYAILRTLEEQVKAQLKKSVSYDEAERMIHKEWLQWQAPDLPAVAYTKIFILYWLLVNHAGDEATIVKTLKDVWYTSIKNDQQQFLTAIGRDATSIAQHPIHVVKNPTKEEVTEWLRQALTQAFSAQQEYFRSHMIGKCTKSGASGQPIDIDIGYFF